MERLKEIEKLKKRLGKLEALQKIEDNTKSAEIVKEANQKFVNKAFIYDWLNEGNTFVFYRYKDIKSDTGIRDSLAGVRERLELKINFGKTHEEVRLVKFQYTSYDYFVCTLDQLHNQQTKEIPIQTFEDIKALMLGKNIEFHNLIKKEIV